MKTLNNFLEANDACEDGYIFAKDLTLEQFLNTCPRGDWILWLFVRTNPGSIRELTLAKAHCANTVRHLMKDKRSRDAVDAAIKFGNGEISQDELEKHSNAAYAAAAAVAAANTAAAVAYDDDDDIPCDAAAYASYASYAAAYAADASDDADAASYAADAASYAAAYDAAYIRKQRETADICRKYLPIEIWNVNQL